LKTSEHLSAIPNTFKTVMVVIVNWNGKEDLLECLDSLRQIDYPTDCYRILVVDNGSTDGSLAAVLQNHQQVELLKNSENIGYVKAVNQGVEYCIKQQADYIWVMNNDVVVKEDSLKKLVEAGEDGEDIGVIAPIVFSYHEPHKIDNVGYQVNLWIGRLEKLKYGGNIFRNPEAEIEDVETILGCSNLIKASIFEKVGLLNPIYKIYFEETDFNFRVRRHGFRVVVVKSAGVLHKHASTMNKFIFRRAYLLLRNLFLFQILNAEFRHLLVFVPYYFFIHIPYFVLYGSVYGIRLKLRRFMKKRCS
jgi:GT2 family glycosyltransferase